MVRKKNTSLTEPGGTASAPNKAQYRVHTRIKDHFRSLLVVVLDLLLDVLIASVNSLEDIYIHHSGPTSWCFEVCPSRSTKWGLCKRQEQETPARHRRSQTFLCESPSTTATLEQGWAGKDRLNQQSCEYTCCQDTLPQLINKTCGRSLFKLSLNVELPSGMCAQPSQLDAVQTHLRC